MNYRLVLAVSLCLLLPGCALVKVKGPGSAITGGIAHFDVVYRSAETLETGPGLAVVAALVPRGWKVASATYTGTVNGSKVSGKAVISEKNPSPCIFGDASFVDLRFIYFVGGPFDWEAGDEGILSIDFRANSPPGVYKIDFWGTGSNRAGEFRCGGEAVSSRIKIQHCRARSGFVALKNDIE